jgi:hypothetical protein
VSSASAPVLRLPFAAKVPLQPPEAVQEVALAEDHVSVGEPPASIVVLDASSDAVGNAVTGAEPPPQADSADAAPNAQSEVMSRMESKSKVLSMLFHGAHGRAKNPGSLWFMPLASQIRLNYVAWLLRIE